MRSIRTLLCAVILAVAPPALAATASAPAKARMIVLSDIGNEPDDSQSLVRLLLYANVIDIEGLVATTSVWQRDRVQPAMIQERLTAYRRVLPRLRIHADGFPDASVLEAVVRSGSSQYGLAGVGEGRATEASRLIVAAADAPDPRPVWISVWGGAADLAQALRDVRANRTPEQLSRFVSRLRVYSISDQDDAGPWIRREFPQLFWIASVHGWNDYGMATWNGISGDLIRSTQWPSIALVSDEWRATHIEKGALGSLYPKRSFIMEGDTPAFLNLVPNGLSVPEHPEFGGWGGRYAKSDLAAGHYGDVIDDVTFTDGSTFRSNQASIFRWRDDFQQDFAARIGWTLTANYAAANHPPLLVVNGVSGTEPIRIAVRAGGRVTLDAAGSVDPDGQALIMRWWHYAEPSMRFRLAPLTITDATTERAVLTAPMVTQPTTFHIILEVSDAGTPLLTRYRRVMIEVTP